VPEADSRVYSNPIASNKSCWYIENRKNVDQPVVTVTGYNSIPAAHFFKELSVCFVPKAVIRSNAAMQVLRLVGFLFLRYM